MKKLFTVIAILFGVVLFIFAMDVVLCPNCKGNGWVVTGYNYYGQLMTATCPRCGGKGVLNIDNSPASKAARIVSLYSVSGGTKYASGTFYEQKMQVVCSGVYLSVSYSDSNNWRYMVRFNNGDKWYFD